MLVMLLICGVHSDDLNHMPDNQDLKALTWDNTDSFGLKDIKTPHQATWAEQQSMTRALRLALVTMDRAEIGEQRVRQDCGILFGPNQI